MITTTSLRSAERGHATIYAASGLSPAQHAKDWREKLLALRRAHPEAVEPLLPWWWRRPWHTILRWLLVFGFLAGISALAGELGMAAWLMLAWLYIALASLEAAGLRRLAARRGVTQLW